MKQLGLQNEIVIFDTEFTAWEGSMERGWNGENEYREIVNIGGIKVNTKTFEEIDSFTVFVKPKINPELSEYFIKLTGITQECIDMHGVVYSKALEMFDEWVGMSHAYSYGGDEKVLKENCDLLGISFPCKNIFFDVRHIFLRNGIQVEKFHSGNIVEAFGQTSTRSEHTALNDARTILDGLRLLSASGI